MSRRILGLDLGEASIGLALVSVGEDEQLHGIERLAVRVFSPVTDAKTKTPLNAGRQAARGARKNRERRARREARLRNALTRAGLLPLDADLRRVVLGHSGTKEERERFDPYRLRARALDDRLEPFELGRVFDHLAERRGFLSNKKIRLAEILKDDPELFPPDDAEESEGETPKNKEEADDLKATLKEIGDLETAIRASGARTLGEYLFGELQSGRKVRGKRTARKMFLDELQAIWESQSRWHADLLSPGLYKEVGLSFDQRPLKAIRTKRPRLQRAAASDVEEQMKRIVKNCTLFPDRAVARRDHFYAHRFRILQTIINLRLRTPNSREELTPDLELVYRLAQRLQTESSLTWAEIRKEWGAPKGAKLNMELEEGKDKAIAGNRTDRFLKSVLGDKWDCSLDLAHEVEERQLEFMQDVDTSTDPQKLYEMLQRPKANSNPIFPLTKHQAFAIAGHAFAQKTVNYSARALRKLAREFLAGAISTHHAREKVQQEQKAESVLLDRLPAPPFIPNPRVRRGLYEIRKVVNALIDKHGKPDEIRIEFARDIKETEVDRKRAMKAQKRNQEQNEAATKFYRENGIEEPTRDQLLKYRLWIECDKHCPYTGRAIGTADLVSERVEVEHILPLPRSGDDSFSNKVLTFQDVNADKGNRTPWEWLQNRPEDWRDAVARIKAMRNPPKLRKFEMKELDEDFSERQLVDTRYVCRAAREYLQCLGIPVWVSNGQATGILRAQWGLNGIIAPRLLKNPDKAKAGEKHRTDHRHHAVDALVVALTTPKRYRQALMLKRDLIKESAPPTPNLREAVKALVERVQTSHDVDKGIRGALHDESFYGRKVIGGSSRFVRRIKLRELVKADFEKTKAKLETVYDDGLRQVLVDRLRAFGDPKQAFDHESIDVRFGSGPVQKIETVRVYHRLTEAAAVDLGHGRWVDPNNNHHAEIVRNAKGKLECRTVSMMAAAKMIRSSRRSPNGLTVRDGETLVMSIAKDEVVEFDGIPMRVVSITDGSIKLRDLNDARATLELEGEWLKGSDRFAMMTRKLAVDELGDFKELNEP